MKILYLTTETEDCLSDSILYGLRITPNVSVLDFPKKDCMYQSSQRPNSDIYGNAFTLWKLLPEISRSDADPFEAMFNDFFDVVIFSDIFRQQRLYAHFNVFDFFKRTKAKFVFLDGSDDGFPTVYDALHKGTYFKRDNPYNYPLHIIGLSIPDQKVLKERPVKTQLISTHCQVPEAFEIDYVRENCTNKKIFDVEKDYYADLAKSKYGICMKKSGWDTPRNMENAANWVVNCIKDFDQKEDYKHPLGLVDMENCIIWHTPQELVDKIKLVEPRYEEVSKASNDWAKTKTCEKMAEYLLSKI